jgi:uncharacterized membrane protein YdbT with pleckstrin-like domain
MSRTYARRSSIKKDLEAGEEMVYIYRHHGIMLSAPIASALGAATVTFGADIVTNDRPILATILILSILLVCGQILAIIRWCSNFFVVTSKRLILSTSPVTDQAVTIELTRGLEVDLQRSWQGYLFGYGSLVIKARGGGKYNVNYVKYSEALYSQLSERIRTAAA